MGWLDTAGGHPRHDPRFDADPPCGVCGEPVDDCTCDECPDCGGYGYPDCEVSGGDGCDRDFVGDHINLPKPRPDCHCVPCSTRRGGGD